MDLQIWKRSVDLAEKIHAVTKSFPSDERFGLISQLRDAAVSVASNIAEGSQRTTNKDFAHFVRIAKGSLAEIQTQILLSRRFRYINEVTFNQLNQEMIELHKMIHSFHSKLITQDS